MTNTTVVANENAIASTTDPTVKTDVDLPPPAKKTKVSLLIISVIYKANIINNFQTSKDALPPLTPIPSDYEESSSDDDEPLTFNFKAPAAIKFPVNADWTASQKG